MIEQIQHIWNAVHSESQREKKKLVPMQHLQNSHLLSDCGVSTTRITAAIIKKERSRVWVAVFAESLCLRLAGSSRGSSRGYREWQ